MRKIVYIGNKPQKSDNVAGTGLSWTPGQTHEVEDDKKAEKLLEHTSVWADASKPFEVRKPLAVADAPPPAQVKIIPQGGEEVSVFWEPIVIPVPGHIFKKLQDKELQAVFMSPVDADAFADWKKLDAATKPDKATLGLPESKKKAAAG